MTTVGAKRQRWTPDQTVAFLKCYIERKDEFQRYRKKRLAYGGILRDLLARSVFDSSMTEALLENKMRSLLRTYRAGRFHPDFCPAIPYLKLIYGDKERLGLRDSIDMSDDTTMNSTEISDYKVGELSYHTLNLSGKPIIALDDGGVKAEKTHGHVSVSPIDIKPELHSRSASPNCPQNQKDGVKSVANEQFLAEKLEMYEKKLENRIQQKRDCYSKMLQDLEKRFRESEEGTMRRHREKMDFFKRLLLK